MSKYLHKISNCQVAAFKQHAVELAYCLTNIDRSIKIKGFRRVDTLSKCCGYQNYSDLVCKAKKHNADEPLRIFNPRHAPVLAVIYAKKLNLDSKVVLAAMIQAIARLDYQEPNDRWTVGEISKYGNRFFAMVIGKRRYQYEEGLESLTRLRVYRNDIVGGHGAFRNMPNTYGVVGNTFKQMELVAKLNKVPQIGSFMDNPALGHAIRETQKMQAVCDKVFPSSLQNQLISKVHSLPQVGVTMDNSALGRVLRETQKMQAVYDKVMPPSLQRQLRLIEKLQKFENF